MKMSKRNILKKIVIGTLTICSISFICVKEGNIGINQNDMGGYANVMDEGIQPKAPITVWKYKEENGKKYMRLYDATNQVWLTDWILCGQ